MSIIRAIKSRLYFTILRIKNKNKDAKTIFNHYYQNNHWRNTESKSGDGSTLEYTKNIRREIPLLMEKLSLKSIFDAPCGDYNWFSHVRLNSDIKYIGADIVEDITNQLNSKYKSNNVSFLTVDVTCEQLPKSDIWMCRDLIFHLPNKDIFSIFDNFLKSEIGYLLITSHTNTINEDTFTGGFRLINLLNHPFKLPDPEIKINDYVDGFPERYLFLYKKECLVAWRQA